MSFYKRGIGSGSTFVPTHPVIEAGKDVYTGFDMVRRSGQRFHVRGITPQQEPTEPIPRIVALISDIGHGMILIAGMWIIWKGLASEKQALKSI